LSASKIFQILLRAFPIILLIAVALHQIFLARSAALSPWSGGGFGMFSTLDHGSRRHLHTFVLFGPAYGAKSFCRMFTQTRSSAR